MKIYRLLSIVNLWLFRQLRLHLLTVSCQSVIRIELISRFLMIILESDVNRGDTSNLRLELRSWIQIRVDWWVLQGPII